MRYVTKNFREIAQKYAHKILVPLLQEYILIKIHENGFFYMERGQWKLATKLYEWNE